MTDKAPATHDEAVKKLGKLIKGIRSAMLTTVDGDLLRARPMATQDVDFDGDLWFFTSNRSHKMEEIEKDNRVCVAYSDPGNNTYISVSGRATMITDRSKIDELWNPIQKAWFPEGKDDPTLCLLKVNVEQAEYWDTPSSTLVNIVGFVKAVTTGKQAYGGENEKLNL